MPRSIKDQLQSLREPSDFKGHASDQERRKETGAKSE